MLSGIFDKCGSIANSGQERNLTLYYYKLNYKVSVKA